MMKSAKTSLIALIPYVFLFGTLKGKDWEPKTVLAKVELTNVGLPIIVPVKISGKEYRFFVDTGTNITILSDRLLGLVGEKVSTAPIEDAQHNTIRIPYYRNPGLRIGDYLVVQDEYIGVEDFQKTDFLVGERVDGVLGGDVLNHLVLHVNYRKNCAILALSETANAPPGREEKIVLEKSRLPYASIRLPSKDVKCLIDTGFFGSASLTKDEFFKSLALKDVLLLYDLPDASSPETVKKQIFWLRAGKCTISSASYDGTIFDLSFDNKIGLYALGRYPITFDFPRGKMYIDDSVTQSYVDHVDMDGLTIASQPTKSTTYTVDYVRRTSLAWRLGFRDGDVIISVDGTPCSDISDSELRRKLGVSRTKSISVSVQRDGRTHEITFPSDNGPAP